MINGQASYDKLQKVNETGRYEDWVEFFLTVLNEAAIKKVQP